MKEKIILRKSEKPDKRYKMEFENKIVLATAFASHRVNGGYFPDTRRFSEGTATLFSNKEMMIYNLTPEDDKLIPSDFTKFNKSSLKTSSKTLIIIDL